MKLLKQLKAIIFLFLLFNLLVSYGYGQSSRLRIQHGRPDSLMSYQVICQLIDGSETEDFVEHNYPVRNIPASHRNSLDVFLNQILTQKNSEEELIDQQYRLLTRVIYKDQIASDFSKPLLIILMEEKLKYWMNIQRH